MSDLTNKTCKELRDIAKEFNITGRWDMTKAELIKAIEACDYSDSEITFETNCIEDSIEAKKSTREYLNNAETGTLVAFKKNKSDAAMSAKFVKFEDDEVIVETKMGTTYRLNPSNIIWVKTGSRWPRWVFNLFRTGKEVDIDNAVSKVRK